MKTTTTILFPSREPIELDFLYSPASPVSIWIDGRTCFIRDISDSVITGVGIERTITVED